MTTLLVKSLITAYDFNDNRNIYHNSAEVMETVRSELDIEQLVSDTGSDAVVIGRRLGSYLTGFIFSDSTERFEDADFITTSRITSYEPIDSDLAVVDTANSRYLLIIIC